MKKIIQLKPAAMGAILVITLSAFAVTPDLVVSETEETGIYTIAYTSGTKAMVKIMLFDKKNTLIHSETLLNISSFERPYNLNGLPKGKYTIVVESNNDQQKQVIHYSPKKH